MHDRDSSFGAGCKRSASDFIQDVCLLSFEKMRQAKSSYVWQRHPYSLLSRSYVTFPRSKYDLSIVLVSTR